MDELTGVTGHHRSPGSWRWIWRRKSEDLSLSFEPQDLCCQFLGIREVWEHLHHCIHLTGEVQDSIDSGSRSQVARQADEKVLGSIPKVLSLVNELLNS